MTKHLIKAIRLGGGPNSEILIPRIPMISKDTDFPVPFKRLQFPVLGAYYLTLNRAQGQTLKCAGMYLPQSVFSHGHLYVGFSRCGDPDCVFVFADQKEFESLRHLLPPNMTFTRNVVYREIFQHESLLD
jgi:ATP-dependent DNA helicase PIF1